MKHIPGILFWAFFTAFSLGNVFKFNTFLTEVRVSPLDIVVVMSLLIFLMYRKTDLLLYLKYPLFRAVFSFWTIALIALLLGGLRFGPQAFLVGLMYCLRWISYSLLPFIFLKLLGENPSARLLLFVGISTVVLGLLQYLIFPDIRSLQTAEWDPHYFRVVGTILDPGYIGLILVLFLVYLTYKIFSHWKFLWLWIPTYLAYALTYSRSSFLAFLVGISTLAFMKKSKKLALIGVFLFIATPFLLPRSPDGEGVKLERTSSIQARITNWSRTANIFLNSPVIGVGFNTYRYAQKQYGYLDESKWLKSHAGAGADSSLLFVAATTGVIGLYFYLRYLKNIISQGPNDYVLISSFAALFTHSLFLNSLFYPQIMFWIGLLISCRFNPKD